MEKIYSKVTENEVSVIKANKSNTDDCMTLLNLSYSRVNDSWRISHGVTEGHVERLPRSYKAVKELYDSLKRIDGRCGSLKELLKDRHYSEDINEMLCAWYEFDDAPGTDDIQSFILRECCRRDKVKELGDSVVVDIAGVKTRIKKIQKNGHTQIMVSYEEPLLDIETEYNAHVGTITQAIINLPKNTYTEFLISEGSIAITADRRRR